MLILGKGVGKKEYEDDGIVHAMHEYWPDHAFILDFDLSEEKTRDDTRKDHHKKYKVNLKGFHIIKDVNKTENDRPKDPDREIIFI